MGGCGVPDDASTVLMPVGRLARIATMAFLVAAILSVVGVAVAYEEPNSLGGTGCLYCHPGMSYPDMDCESCHGDEDDGAGPTNGYEQGNFFGPHGGYTTGTSKCDNCHTVHNAPAASILLLPEATIVATCFTCHDGTSGFGVYGTIEARTGSPAAGGHSFEQTSAVPGGDGATGGTSVRAFNGPGGTLICTDCHSPHGSETVEPFLGDRRRIRYDHTAIRSNRLLKRQPTGASSAVARYGSDWCVACHEGRHSGGIVVNHPVETTATAATPYDYDNLPIMASFDPTDTTVLGTLGGIWVPPGGNHDWPPAPDASANRGYLMPYPRTAQQSGHSPICQQCHEDARNVGVLVGDGSIGDAEQADVWDADGVYWDSGSSTWTAGWDWDNPSFQNFPHETMNSYMLVEQDDDLCMNCHPTAALP